ncbi:MAG: hypothetical protein PHD48_01550 [Alphaproteobacteria bacterium]|nr:hypothetical protein [Alphaproteobacteria bacterium]
MAKNKIEDMFVGVANEVERVTAEDMFQIILTRAKEALEKGLAAVVSFRNKSAMPEGAFLRVAPKQCEVFGEGFAIHYVCNSPRLRLRRKACVNYYAPVPILDLRIKKRREGCCVIRVKYDGKSGKPSGFTALAMLRTDSLPFLDVYDHMRISGVVERALNETPSPEVKGTRNRRPRRLAQEKFHVL